jgi:APA family basic amino acid/polyamine antiporter
LIGGPALGAAMLIAAMIGTLSLSNSTILYTTRVPATMAEDGYLPAWLGKIHPRFGTPVRAIALSTVVYCVLAKYDVEDLVNIYIWTRIATTLLTLFAAWQMRRKAPLAPRSFRIPGGAIGLAYILIFPAVLCLVKVAQSEDYVWRYAPWLLASGPVAYLILRYGLGLRPVAQIAPSSLEIQKL